MIQIIIIAVLVIVAFFCLRKVIRDLRKGLSGKGSCDGCTGGSCSGCGISSGKEDALGKR